MMSRALPFASAPVGRVKRWKSRSATLPPTIWIAEPAPFLAIGFWACNVLFESNVTPKSLFCRVVEPGNRFALFLNTL